LVEGYQVEKGFTQYLKFNSKEASRKLQKLLLSAMTKLAKNEDASIEDA